PSFSSTAPSPMVPDGCRWRTFSTVTGTRYILSSRLRRVLRQTWLRRAAFSTRQVLACWSATVTAGRVPPPRAAPPSPRVRAGRPQLRRDDHHRGGNASRHQGPCLHSGRPTGRRREFV